MVFLLYRGIIQIKAERDLKLTRLSAIISPYLAKFMKSNTAFVHDIVDIFPSIYLLEATYVINSFNIRTELLKLIPDAMIIMLLVIQVHCRSLAFILIFLVEKI